MTREGEAFQSDPGRFMSVLLHAVRGPLLRAIHELEDLVGEPNLKISRSAYDAIAHIKYASSQLDCGYFIMSSQFESVPAHIEEMSRIVFEKELLDVIGIVQPKARDGNIVLRVNLGELQFLGTTLSVDLPLFSLAFWAVLDNAVKYSYQSSSIEIHGCVQVDGALEINVKNRGLPIGPEEVQQCIQLGWRGLKARQIGSGFGWGLPAAIRIMQLHDGKLEIIPQGEVTVVRLRFPIER